MWKISFWRFSPGKWLTRIWKVSKSIKVWPFSDWSEENSVNFSLSYCLLLIPLLALKFILYFTLKKLFPSIVVLIRDRLGANGISRKMFFDIGRKAPVACGRDEWTRCVGGNIDNISNEILIFLACHKYIHESHKRRSRRNIIIFPI